MSHDEEEKAINKIINMVKELLGDAYNKKYGKSTRFDIDADKKDFYLQMLVGHLRSYEDYPSLYNTEEKLGSLIKTIGIVSENVRNTSEVKQQQQFFGNLGVTKSKVSRAMVDIKKILDGTPKQGDTNKFKP